MTVEEERLRRLLAERSAEIPSTVGGLEALHRRIARHRRFRVAGAGAVVLLVATSASIGLAALRPTDPAPPAVAGPSPATPTVTASPAPSAADELLPEYVRGHRRILEREITLPRQSRVTFTFTPDTADFTLGVQCDPRLAGGAVPGRSDHVIEVTVQKTVIGNGDCSSSLRPGPMLVGPDMNAHYRRWSEIGVRVGKPVTVTVTIGEPVPTDDGDPRPGDPDDLAGSMAVGVYTPVPFAQFPLPPRPAELVDLDAVGTVRGDGGQAPPDDLGRLDSAGQTSPNGTYTLSLAMPLQLDIHVCAVAPGRIRVLVDGKQVERREFYGWTGECATGGALATEYDLPPEFKVPVRTGKRVTITVVADSFTAPGWRVSFAKGVA